MIETVIMNHDRDADVQYIIHRLDISNICNLVALSAGSFDIHQLASILVHGVVVR